MFEVILIILACASFVALIPLLEYSLYKCAIISVIILFSCVAWLAVANYLHEYTITYQSVGTVEIDGKRSQATFIPGKGFVVVSENCLYDAQNVHVEVKTYNKYSCGLRMLKSKIEWSVVPKQKVEHNDF